MASRGVLSRSTLREVGGYHIYLDDVVPGPFAFDIDFLKVYCKYGFEQLPLRCFQTQTSIGLPNIQTWLS